MRFSLFADAYDEVPRQVDLSWADFAAKLGPHQYDRPSKLQSPAFSPAAFRPGGGKFDADVIELSMFICDIDHATEEQAAAALGVVEDLGLAAVMYSTWRHAEDPWRLRICVPLSRPVPAAEWRAFWERANALFLGLCDPKCKNQARIFFGPYAPAGTEDSNFYEVFEGKTLDVDSLGAGALPTTDSSLSFITTNREKLSRARLEKFAKQMFKKPDDFSSDIGLRLTQVVKGEPFAEPGERDNVIFKLTSALAKRFPSCDAASVGELFIPSLQLMAKTAGDCPTADDVAKKFTRAQESLSTCTVSTAEQDRIREVFGTDRDTPYTAEEIKGFGQNIKRRWIIQQDKAFYIFRNGTYRRYGEKEAVNAVVRDLAPAKSAGVELFYMHKETLVQKGLNRLVQEYGTVARQTVVDMQAQCSYYDEKSETLVEAPCPLRKDITPTFHEEIDFWLQCLADTEYEILLDWLTLSFDLSSPCVALFITGPKSVGKTLLGTMVASPYGTPPTPLEEVFSAFNSAMAFNPICLADEHLPKDNRGFSRNQDLRFHIQGRQRPLHRKFLAPALLLGATRTLVVANNLNVLSTAESLSVDDIKAIGARYRYIEAQQEAAEYLEKIGEARIKEWVSKNMLAEHMFWLKENHKVTPKGRFMMDPSPEVQDQLIVRNGPRAAVCQWLCGYLSNRELFDDMDAATRLVRIKNGKLLANAAGIVKNWSAYVTNEKCPPTSIVSEALIGISEEKRYKINSKGKAVWYRSVDIEKLFAWVSQSQWLDEDQIRDVLSRDTEDHTLRKKK